MENNEQANTYKVPVSCKIDPAIHAILEQIRSEEDRPMSNMIERLIKTHPRIQPLLETETAGASA